MITDPWITIETKGQDAITIRNCRRIAVSSNESRAIPRGIDDRRFFCFDVRKKQSKDYFIEVRNELQNAGYEALLHELLRVDLDDWHPRSNSPKTAAGEDMRYESSPSPHKFCYHCLLDGINSPPDANSLDGSWQRKMKATALHNYYLDRCTRTRIQYPVSLDQFFDRITESRAD